MTFCDSHLHLSKCNAFYRFSQEKNYMAVSSCHSREDFEFLGASLAPLGAGVPPFADAHSYTTLRNSGAPYPCAFASFGIHPQAVNPSYMEKDFSSDLAYLESLLESKKIVAIGECGFDFFTQGLKSTASEQEIAFESQLDLAQKYSVPLVLHLRKSIDKIFTYSRELKKVPAVIFHSFPGTLREAESLKKHGLNAFFSFGKPLLNGKKSAIDCVKNLPVENLLFETDAPYQTLKDEEFTSPEEIERVYEKACGLRSIGIEELCILIEKNFSRAFL